MRPCVPPRARPASTTWTWRSAPSMRGWPSSEGPTTGRSCDSRARTTGRRRRPGDGGRRRAHAARGVAAPGQGEEGPPSEAAGRPVGGRPDRRDRELRRRLPLVACTLARPRREPVVGVTADVTTGRVVWAAHGAGTWRRAAGATCGSTTVGGPIDSLTVTSETCRGRRGPRGRSTCGRPRCGRRPRPSARCGWSEPPRPSWRGWRPDGRLRRWPSGTRPGTSWPAWCWSAGRGGVVVDARGEPWSLTSDSILAAASPGSLTRSCASCRGHRLHVGRSEVACSVSTIRPSRASIESSTRPRRSPDLVVTPAPDHRARVRPGCGRLRPPHRPAVGEATRHGAARWRPWSCPPGSRSAPAAWARRARRRPPLDRLGALQERRRGRRQPGPDALRVGAGGRSSWA